MLQNLKLASIFVVVAFLFACPAPATKSSTGSVSGGLVVPPIPEPPNTPPLQPDKPILPEGWDDIGNIVGSARDYWAGQTQNNKAMFYFEKEKEPIDGVWTWKVRTIPMSDGAPRLTLYAVSGGNSGVTDGKWKGRFFPLKEQSGVQKPDPDESKGYNLTIQFTSSNRGTATLQPMPSNKTGFNFGTFIIAPM